MLTLESAIKRFASKFGVEIFRVSNTPNADYEAVRPTASYSPWNLDSEFMEAYAIIKDFTLVDRYRCFELWKLIEQSAKLSTGSMIEIGVWRGGTGAMMARRAKLSGIQEKMYLCDTFSGIVKATSDDADYKGGEHADTSKKVVEDLVQNRLQLDNVEILQGIFPDQTGHVVEGLQFRFCHVDVDVYQSAKDVVEWIWTKMVPGGIMVYDDYGFRSTPGIRKFVEEQTHAKDRIIIHNLNGHAVVIKL